MERSSIQIQIFEDGHDKRPHDILPESASFPYLLGKKEGKKKFYYLSSCWADAIREAVTWGEGEGSVLLFLMAKTWTEDLLVQIHHVSESEKHFKSYMYGVLNSSYQIVIPNT